MESFVGSHFLLSSPVSLQVSSHASQIFCHLSRTKRLSAADAVIRSAASWRLFKLGLGVKGRVSYPNQSTGNITVLGHEQVIL